MELWNKSGVALASVLVLLGGLIAAQSRDDAAPSPAQIEALGTLVGSRAARAAERRLEEWVGRGLPVAQRELGAIYLRRPGKRGDALQLLELAAHGGDVEAAFQLGDLCRNDARHDAAQVARARGWYRLAAEGKHARAALMLGLLAQQGPGMLRDDAEAAKWLDVAAHQGNAQAMYLLSGAYRSGRGVPRDPAKSRHWLEMAAARAFPLAVRELSVVPAPDGGAQNKYMQRAAGTSTGPAFAHQ